MDALQARVAALLQKAELVAGGSAVLPYLGLGGWLASKLLTSDVQQQHAHNVSQARFLFEDWATTKRRWALAGAKDSGAAYTAREYKQLGNEIGALVSDLLGLYWEAAPLATVVDATVATVKDVGSGVAAVGDGLKAAAESVARPWPTSVKVALVAGALVLGVVGVGYGVRSVRAVIPV